MWLVKGRTVLTILSIAIGIFCVGTLFGLIDLQLAKMDAAHREARPSHISLILRKEADSALIPEIKAVQDVSGVDTLTPLTVRYKLKGNPDWQLGTLLIRPPPSAQRYDLTSLISGNWPAGEQIAIEHLSSNYTGISIGGNVEFETVDGSKNFPVTGVVRHPFVKPPQFGGQVHFFADKDLARQFGTRHDSFKQLLAQVKPPYSPDKARAVARDIRTVLNNRHIGVAVTLLQDPEKHWGRPFFTGINGVLQWMALASLILACVLVFNTVSAHITQQINQIGIMKSLGGSQFIIAKVYLAEVLVMALLAVVIAVAPSLAVSYLSACKLLALFNIDCGEFSYSTRALYLMIIGGLLAPLLAALPPIMRGAAMNTKEAIASYGLASNFGKSRFDLAVEWFGKRFLSTMNAAALGNLFRRKGRLFLTQSVLIIAGAVFLILMSLIASVNLTLDNEMARSGFTVRLGFSADQEGALAAGLAESLARTQKVELWRRLPVEISRNDNALKQKGSLGLQMLALPAASVMYRPLIESGRWFTEADASRRVVALSADTAGLNGIKAGDSVTVRIGPGEQTWQVIGLYRWLAGNNFVVEPVYAPLEKVQELSGQQKNVSFALVEATVETLAEEADYLRQLKQVFEDKGIRLDAYTTQAKLEQRLFARNQLNPVIGTLSGLAAMIAVVGGIGLSGTLAIGVLQRSREIGVLLAIGAPSNTIFKLFIWEGFFHGLFAWLISIPIAYYLAEPVSAELGKNLFGIRLDYVFETKAVGYWLAITLCLAFMASFWPALGASRKTVNNLLSHNH